MIPDHSSMESAEANLFGFLARLWIAEADDAVVRSLNETATRDGWESLGGYVPTAEQGIVDELENEFCACFLGPTGHLPPHQSVVEQSHFQGDCVSSMLRYVDVVGLPEGDLFEKYHSLIDHIGIQLAMAQRIWSVADEVSGGASSELFSLRVAFFNEHLYWVLGYCKVAAARCKSKFYSSLFAVTSDFLLQIQKELHELSSSESWPS